MNRDKNLSVVLHLLSSKRYSLDCCKVYFIKYVQCIHSKYLTSMLGVLETNILLSNAFKNNTAYIIRHVVKFNTWYETPSGTLPLMISTSLSHLSQCFAHKQYDSGSTKTHLTLSDSPRTCLTQSGLP